MKTTFKLLWLAPLFVGLAASCSLFEKEEDEDDDDGLRPDSGAQLIDSSTPTINAPAEEAPACPEIQGLTDQSCQLEERTAQPSGAMVLLVMDKSASMSQMPAGYAVSKWEAVRTALSTALDTVKGFINLGLEFFPTTATPGLPIDPNDTTGQRSCEMPGGNEPNIPIQWGPTAVPLIIQELQNNVPAGGTPTAVALWRAYDYFTVGGGAGLPGERYVLLATDGGPNCNDQITCTADTCTLNLDSSQGCYPGGDNCCYNLSKGCLDDARTVQLVQALASVGVKTIVVGIPGAEAYSGLLQQAADAGGFVRSDGSTNYYRVDAAGGAEALTTTFLEITTELVKDCVVTIQGEVPNPNAVNVAVDCVLIPQESSPEDTVDRWRFDNPEYPTAVILDGPICEHIQQNGVGRIDVILGCPTLTVT